MRLIKNPVCPSICKSVSDEGPTVKEKRIGEESEQWQFTKLSLVLANVRSKIAGATYRLMTKSCISSHEETTTSLEWN